MHRCGPQLKWAAQKRKTRPPQSVRRCRPRNLSGLLRRGLPTACAAHHNARRRKHREGCTVRRGRPHRVPHSLHHSESESIARRRKHRERCTVRSGIRAKPQRERRNEGPAPPARAPLRPASDSCTLNVRTPLGKHCLGNTPFPLILNGSPQEKLRKCYEYYGVFLFVSCSCSSSGSCSRAGCCPCFCCVSCASRSCCCSCFCCSCSYPRILLLPCSCSCSWSLRSEGHLWPRNLPPQFRIAFKGQG